jgi:ornithine cyclodeaminase
MVSAIEEALRDYAGNKVVVPVRQHLDFGGNSLLIMPAIGGGAFGVKLVSVVPSNGARGIPVTTGLMILCDGASGRPLAVFDAAMLTAQRTGAVGAVGLKYTTPRDVDRIGIIGTGVQGTWQAIYACAVRKIHTVYFVARSNDKAQRFIAAVSRHAPGPQFWRCADAQELLKHAPVVIAATTSSEPVVPAVHALLANKHFVSIGSYKPSMKELPHSVYELAQQVVVDSNAAKSEVGDVSEPLSMGLLREENIIHISDLVVGNRSVDVASTTVFKSVGMALYDLYAARAFFDEARRLGRGVLLESLE